MKRYSKSVRQSYYAFTGPLLGWIMLVALAGRGLYWLYELLKSSSFF